jgi:hypothetical protein
MDFFTVEAVTWAGLVRFHVLFVIDLATRRVELAGIVHQPHEAWMLQVARNLTDVVDGFLLCKRYLIMDRDPLFTRAFRSMPGKDRGSCCLAMVVTEHAAEALPARNTAAVGGVVVLCSDEFVTEPQHEACEEARITRRFTSHGFRRTLTDLLRNARVDPVIAAGLTGHETERMRRHYSTVRSSEAVEAGERVARLLQPRAESIEESMQASKAESVNQGASGFDS